MKSSSIFVLIFIGFLAAAVHGDSTSTTEAVTTPVEVTTTAAVTEATQATDATTIASSGTTDSQTGGVTDAPGTTVESVTGASSGTGETNAPQSTVPSGSTAAPPTTAASCPQQDIFLVKDGSPSFSANVPAGLNCSYFARSTSFTKSITINDPITFNGDGATLKISGEKGVLYDSSDSSPASPPIPSKSSQIEINILTTTSDASVSLKLVLQDDTCTTTPDPCLPGGTCKVIQGQETCTCQECYIGARCEIPLQPCATYDLVCKTKSPPQKCVIDSGCTPKCTTIP